MHNQIHKKYQVFVSSTYEDLRIERQKVIETLHRMDCFPIGMEHFNAYSQKWDVIKKMIKECDYFILILAGRYGSIEESSGKGYIEQEYDYAQYKNIPILAFNFEHPEELPNKNTECIPERKEKLANFITRVGRDKLWLKWNSPDDLASKVATSLSLLIKENPRVGWIKASCSTEIIKNNQLEEQNNSLNQQIVSLINEKNNVDKLRSKILEKNKQLKEQLHKLKQKNTELENEISILERNYRYLKELYQGRRRW